MYHPPKLSTDDYREMQMPGTTVSEAVARPARTAIQSTPAFALIELLEAFEVYDFTDRQYGVTLMVLTAIVSFIQNKIENNRGKGFFLRSVPPLAVPVEGA